MLCDGVAIPGASCEGSLDDGLKIVRLDVDAEEIMRTNTPEVAIEADAVLGLQALCDAIPKLASHRQAAGEAVYSDDNIPGYNAMFASYVPATVSNATIVSIDRL